MNRPTALLSALLAAAGPALGQGAAPPRAEGRYRIVGRAGEAPVGGSLRIRRIDGELRYERRSRADLEGPPRVERGRALLRDGALLTRADRVQARGFTGLLRQERSLFAPLPPTLARYFPAAEGWRGARHVPESGPVAERLLPWDPSRDGNQVRLLIDGEAFGAMEEAIRGARRTIDLQTFQWADDGTGRRIARLLMAQARAGLRVRCLVDSSSSFVNSMVSWHTDDPIVDLSGRIWRRGLPRGTRRPSLADDMRAAGIEVIVQHGATEGIKDSVLGLGRRIGDSVGRLFGRRPRPRERRSWTAHDHRKLLIVDERVAFCGGMNVAAEYEHDWHDVQARVEGPAAHAVHRLFVDRWTAAGGHGRVAPAPRFDEAFPGDVPVDVLGSVPGLSREIRHMYEREIREARERIRIEVAYFLDDRVIDLLCQAAGRGVDTLVIVPDDRVNDVYLVKEAFAWVHNEVVRSGVKLYFYQPRLNHSKLAVFDGERTTVGSSNLDRMALDLVAEANLYVPDARFAREVERRIFDVDLPQSVRAEVRELGWARSLRSRTLHFFRGWL